MLLNLALGSVVPSLCAQELLTPPQPVPAQQTALAQQNAPSKHSIAPQKAVSAQDRVRIATGEWLPYISPRFSDHGVLARIVTEAFALSGVEVEYGYFPWTRGYQLAQEGEWDAVMPFYCSAERAAVSYCSHKLIDGEQVFFHLKSVPFDWENMEDLRDVPIGATLGYYYGEAFEQAEQQGQLKVRHVAQEETNFQLLVKGVIRLFPLDRRGGYDMIRNVLPPDQQALITHHPKPLHRESFHLLFPKDKPRSERLVKLFNRGLEKLQAQGRVDRYIGQIQDGQYRLNRPQQERRQQIQADMTE